MRETFNNVICNVVDVSIQSASQGHMWLLIKCRWSSGRGTVFMMYTVSPVHLRPQWKKGSMVVQQLLYQYSHQCCCLW